MLIGGILVSLRGAQFNAGHAGGGDCEVFLMLKEFQPALSRGGDMVMDFLSPQRGSLKWPARPLLKMDSKTDSERH